MKVSYQPTWLVFIFPVALAGFSGLLDFNGLYGQDSYEYLRQSRVLFDRLNGLPVSPGGIGDAELAGGYPLVGALFQFTGISAIHALQLVSWLSAAIGLWLFELNLRVLSPGARVESRWAFGLLSLALAPFFLRAGLTIMSDGLGLAFALAALFFALRVIELEKHREVVWFAVFAALAVTTRYAIAALLAVPALTLALELWRARLFSRLALTILAGFLTFLPFLWIKMGAPQGPLAHSLLQDWSLVHLFQATFTQASGTVTYQLPNIFYLLFPLVHPGFCLTLPALFLLARRTDVALYSKRLLLLSLLLYLLLLGGLSHQNVRYLLPAYALLLLLFFPAWDRFFAYGFYFFKRLAFALLGLTLLCQLFFTAWALKPTLSRNHLEQEISEILDNTLPPGADVYAFDLDIAMQARLPGIRFHNLFIQRYDSFPEGSFILFNEPKLRDQWSGQNPMLNWEHARSHFELLEYRSLPEGWTLYQVINSK